MTRTGVSKENTGGRWENYPSSPSWCLIVECGLDAGQWLVEAGHCCPQQQSAPMNEA